MKKNIKYLLISGILLILSILVSLMTIWSNPLPETKITTNVTETGESFVGVCISDLLEEQIFTYANYTPDEFVQPNNISGKPINLKSATNLAQKGTLQFVVYNIDPADPSFHEKKDALESFLQGDNYWHFSLYLPAIFSSANIYVKSVLSKKIGEISNYDYINYSDYQGVTEHHTSETEPQTLDLRFYSRQRGIPISLEQRCSIITIHYEAPEGWKSGLNSLPILGKEEFVHQIKTRDRTFVIVIALLALLISSIIAFTSFLKKNLLNLPQLLITIGISFYMLVEFLFLHNNKMPYFLLALHSFSIALISTSALFRTKLKFKKFPVFILIFLYAILYIVLFITSSILPAKNAIYLKIIVGILSIPLGIFVFSKGLFKILKYKEIPEGGSWIVISVFTIATPFTQTSQMIILSSTSWLLILILGVIGASTFLFFVQLEQQNKYLTTNLQNEVLLQTQDLTNIISERDRLLRFLSHDMRKPILSIRGFLSDLKTTEKIDARYKKIEIIENKINDIDHDLGDLQKYSKLSYSAENFSKILMSDILNHIYTSLNPDCEANAIHLNIDTQNIYVYAKKNTLISVLNNLIFNAIEHAECKTIEINATKYKGKCKVTVIDDGKGLENENKVFMPYYTDSGETDHMGLGLYICKQYLASMGGNLLYSRENNQTCFTLFLPLA